MATYVESIAKLQAQGLEVIQQVGDAQVQALSNLRTVVTEMAPVTSLDQLPSMQTIAELNTKFATQMFELQKTYANKFAELFTPVQK